MRITRAVVPSLFTTLNAFCGFLSIVNASQGRIQEAAGFIILAGVFDMLDGFMARLTKTSSKFGVELDSLADVVSFGAAPSFLVYQAYLSRFDTIGLIISAMPLAFGAIRLARFNIQLVGFDKDYFNGLPIPHQALVICALFLTDYSPQTGLIGWKADVLAPLTVILSLVMVSRIRYETFPKFDRKNMRAHPWKLMFFALGGIIVAVSKGALLFEVALAFVVFGLLRAAVKSLREFGTHKEQQPDSQEDGISSIDF